MCEANAENIDETCPACGGDAGDNYFDRSVCACGAMHTCCDNCGHALDGCPYDESHKQRAATNCERPPWNQELTPDEAATMLAVARAVGGEVEKWAVIAYYIQSALASEVGRLELELARTKRRYANARRGRRDLRAALDELLPEARDASP